MEIISPEELVSDFRCALDVMEESDHLGLDDKHARLLCEIIQRRIHEAFAALSSDQPHPSACQSTANGLHSQAQRNE